MWFEGERGSVFLRETAPGVLILSWYPHSQADPGWPGSIIGTSMHSDFVVGSSASEQGAVAGCDVERWKRRIRRPAEGRPGRVCTIEHDCDPC
jgi:hypothetical protein